MKPGEHLVILCNPCTLDYLGFSLRRRGLEIRDCFSIRTSDNDLVGFLVRKPMESTVLESVLRKGTGTLDIDAGRISTDETFRGGGGKLWSHYRDSNEDQARVFVNDGSGRYPSNFLLVHGSDCEKVGTKKIGSGPEGGYSYTNKTYEVDGFVPKCRPKSSSNRGTEEVADWNCQLNCPVRLLDLHSGNLEHSFRTSRDHQGGMMGWTAGNGAGYQDEGGASRYFYQATTLEEIKSYLKDLTL